MAIAAPHIIDVEGANYPPSLRRLARPPRTLWVRSANDNFKAITVSYGRVAIVGSRGCDRRHAATAETMAGQLAAAGIPVISGGALGIDAAAHRGALRAGGLTAAVLGCGVDITYPDRHGDLFAAIAAHGALISQFAPGVTPRRGTFVSRNTTMAALVDAVLLIGAERGSGALHTVRAARALGIPVLASPGAPACDALLAAHGALPCLGAEDALAVVERRYSVDDAPAVLSPAKLAELTALERAVLAVLMDQSPLDASTVANRLAVDLVSTRRALAALELEEAIEMISASQFRPLRRQVIRRFDRACTSK